MINQWSDKYSNTRGGAPASGGPRLSRFYAPVLAALLIALVLLGIFGGQAIVYRSTSEKTFVNRMLTECDEALASVKGLSRSGGSESAAILGKIRANIHAVDAINSISNSIAGGGGYFVDPAVFTRLYGVIDSYSNNLKLGNVTIEDLNDLTLGLEALKETLAAL
ncbi:MAG: hypothetical protein IJ343_14485 [Clostridia bacterium]|nr:hypothetical protein [Clostridia bacterium]